MLGGHSWPRPRGRGYLPNVDERRLIGGFVALFIAPR
jgi:hypothetical protein